MEERHCWLVFGFGLLVAICFIIIACTKIVCTNTEKMAELGYQEVVLPGHNMPVWQKAEKEE